MPYQNPKLSANAEGNLEVLQDQMKKEEAVRKRKAAVDAKRFKEAEFLESYKQWERDAYTRGKQVTRRTNGTKERAEINLARFGYSFDIDPRFNGEHKALGYDGVGPDPCDPHNQGPWFKNPGVGKPLG